MFGCELVQKFRLDETWKVDSTIRTLRQPTIDYFDRIIQLMKEDKNLSSLLQALKGPVLGIKWTRVDRLAAIGIIVKEGDSYRAFSDSFETYLSIIQREYDIWPLWAKAERALRSIVASTMHKHLGEIWIEKSQKERHKLVSTFDECHKIQLREKQTFGDRASNNLLDYAHIHDLFYIAQAYWNEFKGILGKDKQYWDTRRQLLSKVRNPIAHNRETSLHDFEIRLAEAYCEEILEIWNTVIGDATQN
ncbi:hypothetical protein ES708_29621 [subsurface metagenome]